MLDRYLLREVGTPFLLGLFGLTAIFLINQFVRLADLFVGRGLSLSALAKLLGVLAPPFLLITLPSAVFLAGIVAFSRLSSDSELTAFKAAGISFFRLMRPIVLGATLVAAGAITLGVIAEPWGKGKLKHLAMDTLKNSAGLAITPGTFNHVFGDVVVYAEQVSPQGRLTHVFISDERNPQRPLLVTASSGALSPLPERQQIGFFLKGGEIFRPGEVVERVRFDSYSVTLTLAPDGTDKFADIDAIQAEFERRRAAGEPVGKMLQLMLDHSKNITFGVACFIFGLLGPALGIHQVRSGRMGGFTVGVVLILCYYLLMSVAQALVMGEKLPIQVGAWMPNGVFALGTLYVLWRTQQERPLRPSFGGKRS